MGGGSMKPSYFADCSMLENCNWNCGLVLPYVRACKACKKKLEKAWKEVWSGE